MDVPAVAVADLRVLALDLERPARLGRDRARRAPGPGSRPRPGGRPRPGRARSPRRAEQARGGRAAGRARRPRAGRARRPGSRGRWGRPRRGTGRTPCRASRRAGRGPCRRGRPGARRSRASSPPSAARRRVGRHRATSAPRCGQSSGEGPSASEFGVGARWPVRSRWAVERWAKSSWLIERTIASRCACAASRGKCSLIRTPGRLVAIVRELAADLGGGVGLGVPGVELARARPTGRSGCRRGPGRSRRRGRRRAARRRKSSGSPRPVSVSAPARSASRRVGAHAEEPAASLPPVRCGLSPSPSALRSDGSARMAAMFNLRSTVVLHCTGPGPRRLPNAARRVQGTQSRTTATTTAVPTRATTRPGRRRSFR